MNTVLGTASCAKAMTNRQSKTATRRRSTLWLVVFFLYCLVSVHGEAHHQTIIRPRWLARLVSPRRRFLAADASSLARRGPFVNRRQDPFPIDPAKEANDDDHDEEEEEDHCDDNYYPAPGWNTQHTFAPLSTLSAVLQTILSDKQRLGRWTASGLQVGLLIYLGRAVWKTLAEVMEEYSNELNGDNTGLVYKHDDMARVLALLEDHPNAMSTTEALNQAVEATPPSRLPSMPLLQLVRKLLMSGLPLRSTESRPTSVESVISSLTKAEAALLAQCLWSPPLMGGPDDLHNMWSSVVGLFPVKERLIGVLSTMRGRHKGQAAYGPLFDAASTLRAAHSSGRPASQGVLLYGPPGCGKTMLVRALATTSRLPCLTVTPSVLLRKYVGETNSQVRNLFSLAGKLAPCILCIDELDGLFRERSESEHEVSRDLKTEFLQWWDGMLNSETSDGEQQPILVIGASNRPFDVDSAVLRRLPQSHFVGLPDTATRSFLMKQLLQNVPTDDDLDLFAVAMQTEGYSPSDLRQLLQTAALMGPMKGSTDDDVRPLATQDILQALPHTPPTQLSQSYQIALANFARLNQHRQPSGNSQENKWETGWGNFYNIGTLQVDRPTFDALAELVHHLENQMEMEESEEEDGDD